MSDPLLAAKFAMIATLPEPGRTEARRHLQTAIKIRRVVVPAMTTEGAKTIAAGHAQAFESAALAWAQSPQDEGA